MLSFTYMMNQNITSVTDLHRGDIALHSSYKTDDILSFVFGVRSSEIFLCRTLCVLKCLMTSIGRQCSEERTFIETLLQSLWYVTASGTNVLFYCQMSG